MDLTVASWNQVVCWLRRVDGLRQAQKPYESINYDVGVDPRASATMRADDKVKHTSIDVNLRSLRFHEHR